MRLTVLLITALLLAGCQATSISTQTAKLGRNASFEEMRASLNTPGPIVFQKHLAANWEVNLSGLVNLNHNKAITAGMDDRAEAIEIYTYSLQHPSQGNFLVDSGVADSFRHPDQEQNVAYLVKQVMGMEKIKVQQSTQQIANSLGAIAGVFLTHIHLDHIMGLNDLPFATQVYIGPGDTALSDIQHLATQGTTDRLIGKQRVLAEWDFTGDGVIDVFGDGSLWAIHAPGHTPGATAYIARTATGPEFMVGDASHTRWGWNNAVEPGSFSHDQAGSVVSLNKLLQLAADFPQMKVHLGHQSLQTSDLAKQ